MHKRYENKQITIEITFDRVCRIGRLDLLQQEDRILQFPASLQQFAPLCLGYESINTASPLPDAMRRNEVYLGTQSNTPREWISTWQEARKDLWIAQEPTEKTLKQWLQSIDPPCAIDAHDLFTRTQPCVLSIKAIQRILSQPYTITLHKGYTHNALLPRRIRENGFICWRHAKTDGFRGVDEAPYLSPIDQPLDILLHILKWSWKNNPTQAIECLQHFQAFSTQPTIPKSASIHYSHSRLSQQDIAKILGCKDGIQSISTIRKALYRAKKIPIAGEHIQIQTLPSITPQKDDAYFLIRDRSDTQLFSRWNNGIQLDKDGRFSLTPEKHATKIADNIVNFYTKHSPHPSTPLSLWDVFAGCGGNSIAFARHSQIHRVIATELDTKRIAMAKHNASIYQAEKNITFRNIDALEHCGQIQADVVFLDPPWVWNTETILDIYQKFRATYACGMIKLPITFPIIDQAPITLFFTENNFPSFLTISWYNSK